MNGLRLLSSRFAGRAAQAAAALTLLCSMTACNTADPIVGEWQSDRRLENGERNQMFFYSDNSGEAEIYASPPGQPGVWLRIDFETEWTEFAGSEFDDAGEQLGLEGRGRVRLGILGHESGEVGEGLSEQPVGRAFVEVRQPAGVRA